MSANKNDVGSKYSSMSTHESRFKRLPAAIGFTIGILISATIFVGIFVVLFALGLSGVEPPAWLYLPMALGAIVGVVLPFALFFWLGRTGEPSSKAKQRNAALDLEPPPNLWFGYDGRINRKSFIVIELVVVVLTAIAFIFESIFLSTGFTVGFSGYGISVIFVVGFVVSISPIVRRLHDLGLSGWFSVLWWIPYLGLVSLVLLAVAPGNRSENKFGPSPQLVEVTVHPG